MRDMTVERHMKPRPALPARTEEFIDIQGHLRVPVPDSMTKAPERDGWEPFFVNVNLKSPIQKVIIYRKVNNADS